ncbi:regulatory protein spx [Pilibacter termitis]|jgi:regulatory protein spx|uniref:Regulatory protein spx n=1 Tax=Pilibacter termitis TaxID=263852 RepID=A0A1T4LVR8_9ENTE|nr:transcriptional regulator Spx [Pilibacter termitis]SJZ58731.1 regulatory protein spx [Pilibacter termitis]
MLTLYFSPSCTSCRKEKAWLNEHKLPYKERNIFQDPLQADELKELLMLTENGTEDLISERSKVFQKLDMDFDDLSMSELLNLVQEHPSLLRRPMLTDGQRLLIGFNDEEIRMFLPRDLKKMEQKNARLRAGL